MNYRWIRAPVFRSAPTGERMRQQQSLVPVSIMCSVAILYFSEPPFPDDLRLQAEEPDQ